ncbi:hypothetical protein HMPREF3192_01392 [Atopobium deltae]|uniref:Uncharacterized protein n=1 Tax=Atopobium deltae TaxID=1393034 RepID=A0A133XPZ8_9ACTN|nr:hypothetical protein HMPREF3192_01392 [Atopobium deltae]
MDRKTFAVTQTAIATNLHETGYILANLTAEVTLNGIVVANSVTKLCYFVLSEVTNMSIWIYPSNLTNLVSAGAANAVDIGQTDLDALLAREVDTVNTGQLVLLS